ncbi:MAG: hypothetical protein GXY05_12685 [Clostridiales bacterium]|nr:hypothetical protein [Clostridiales bacterium]
MLGKLIKYEFRATARICLPLFGALLLAACISRLFESLRFETPMVIGIALSVILIIATFVIVLIVTLLRFYRNLLTNEGYLMFTLPVTADSLIWSKLIVAFVWNILSLIVVFAAILIMAVTDLNLSDISLAITAGLNAVGITQAQFNWFVVEMIVLFLVSLPAGIIVLYACMASSQLVNKYRILFSFGAYIVLSIIGQILGSIAMFIFLPKHMSFYSNPSVTEVVNMVNTAMLFSIASSLIAGVALYIVTRFMLKRKLNLE